MAITGQLMGKSLGFIGSFGTILFWLFIALIIGAIVFAIYWFTRFKYTVEVHAERSGGAISKYRTKVGFFKRLDSKVEVFRILSDLKHPIKPPTNWMIAKDNTVFLRRTAHDEFIPMTIIQESIDPVTKQAKQQFGVHSEYIKGWLRIKDAELRQKFSVPNFIEKYGVILSLGIILVIFIIGMKFINDNVALSIQQSGELLARTARLSTAGAP